MPQPRLLVVRLGGGRTDRLRDHEHVIAVHAAAVDPVHALGRIVLAVAAVAVDRLFGIVGIVLGHAVRRAVDRIILAVGVRIDRRWRTGRAGAATLAAAALDAERG